MVLSQKQTGESWNGIRDPNVNPHIYRQLMFLNRNQYYIIEKRKTLSELAGSSQSDLGHTAIWTIPI